MIKLSVWSNEGYGIHNQWWLNFTDYYEELGFDMIDDNDISKALKDWHGINSRKTVYIKFRDEKDLTMFMLRWS